MRKFLIFIAVVSMGMLAMTGCKKNTTPNVVTVGASNVTSTSATLSATIVEEGNESILSSGFYYSTSPNMDNKLTALNPLSSLSSFSVTVSELQPNTQYYFQAYAINGKGAGVGEIMSFKTTDNSGGGGHHGGPEDPPTIGLLDSFGQSSTNFNIALDSERDINIEGRVSAPSGISNLDLNRITYNENNEVVSVITYYFSEPYEGMTEYTYCLMDTLWRADYAQGFKVEYVASVTDSNNRQAEAKYTIDIISPSLPLTDWSETIYLTKSSMTSWASINGTPVTQYENTTIGVSVGTSTSTEITFSTTYNCEGFVIVYNDDYTLVDQLEEAYNAGEVLTSSSVPYDYYTKTFSPKTFISKVDNEYVLVKIVSAVNSPNGTNGVSGTVLGFKYKKKQLVA